MTRVRTFLTLAWCLLPFAFVAQSPASLDKYVDVSGYRLHYTEAGSGPPIILLHGLGADLRTWRLVTPVLARRFHVYALDQLGFGQSEKPQISYRVGTLVDSLNGFLAAVRIDKASVVGNSLGGWVAAMFAATHPERLDKLVLVDAAGYGATPSEMIRDYLSQMIPRPWPLSSASSPR